VVDRLLLHDSLSEPKVQFNRKILFKKFNINVTFYALMLTNHFHTKEDTSSAWTWKGTTEGSKKSWRPGVHGVCSSTIFWSENSRTPFPGRRLGYSGWVLPYDHDGDGDDSTHWIRDKYVHMPEFGRYVPMGIRICLLGYSGPSR
jgi:hypothetical protein